MAQTKLKAGYFSKIKAFAKALELGKSATEHEISQIEQKLPSMKKGRLKSVWDKVLVLWQAFKSDKTPRHIKIEIIGCLLYILLPTDLIFDGLPGIGFLDDIAVVLFIFKKLMEIAVPLTVTASLEKGKKEIEARLNAMFYSIINSTIISFLLTVIAFITVIVMPFGYTASCCVAALIFLGMFGFWAYLLIQGIKKYGKTTLHVARCIIAERHFRRGIERWVCEEYKIVDRFYKVVRTGSFIVPSLSEIPDIQDIVTLYVKMFWKRVAVFFASLALYTILITFIAKPLLINRFAGLTVPELYLFPITHILRTIRILN